MAIKLYNPRTKAFTSFTAPNDADLPLNQLLLLNILIELHAHTHYLANIQTAVMSNLYPNTAPTVPYEDVGNIRTDIVSVL